MSRGELVLVSMRSYLAKKRTSLFLQDSLAQTVQICYCLRKPNKIVCQVLSFNCEFLHCFLPFGYKRTILVCSQPFKHPQTSLPSFQIESAKESFIHACLYTNKSSTCENSFDHTDWIVKRSFYELLRLIQSKYCFRQVLLVQSMNERK